MLKTLVFLVICDYILGVIALNISKETNSSVGYRGIFKKFFCLYPLESLTT
ncbi:phage holin family protein [Tissierella simiarum]|uniref:phage holin family protein n=1 Tax=Tissierella simiarum TaxID=2841534 RepID=UPI003CCEAB03